MEDEFQVIKVTPYARLRKWRGIGQEVLAGLIGICRKSLSDYERGKKDPPKHVVIALDEFYKCKGELIDYWIKTKFSWRKKKNTIWTAIQTVLKKFLSYFKLYQSKSTKSMR